MELTHGFPLADGRLVRDERIAEKLFMLINIAPEGRQNETTNYTWDEAGMAELFSKLYEGEILYCVEAQSWYCWNKGCWRKDVGGVYVAEMAKEFIRILTLYCGEIADEEIRKKYEKHVKKFGNHSPRVHMIADATSCMALPIALFDNHPELINCQNGVYDLNNMVFREARPQDYLTLQTAFEYTQQDMEPNKRWITFIKEVCCGDDSKADYLQRALGYSMFGSAAEECMFILYGKTTRNGKSTLLGTLDHMLGDYAKVSPVSIICKADRAKNADSASPVLAALKGKRFVSMAESNQYGRLDEETIKQLTGGEEIMARNLYEAPISYLPQFKMWLSCNDLPQVYDMSIFASDRIRVIAFDRHFTAEERDPHLKEYFRTPEAMRGIFAWLIEGYFKYKRYGLVEPHSVYQSTLEYHKESDLVLQFLEERCEKVKGIDTRGKLLYDAYKIWCENNGFFCGSSRKFNGEFERSSWYTGETLLHGYRTFKGVRLRV